MKSKIKLKKQLFQQTTDINFDAIFYALFKGKGK